ncbi:MAG TPA: glycosyl hydrolase family 18 protein, partial [Terriglobia bacterium]|nr:glycosyl hydrolase family 18 protein [Terriglobia bacterium]
MIRKICLFVLFGALFVPNSLFAQQQWSLGYWTPWGNPTLSPSQIEWGGLTHVIHAWALVQSNGSLDLSTQRISSDGPTLVANAHSHGVKAILGIGQMYWSGQTTNLQSAITSNRATLVNNIMNVVDSYGFDGVDIDWEPFNSGTNGSALQAFASDLRSRLGSNRTLSAAAIVTDYRFWGSVQTYFDRIGIMTYDMTGTWNPYSWHNAALYGPSDNQVWSVDLAVNRFIANGVPAAKVSIGIPFFGYRWTGGGITGPRQTWSTAPGVSQIYYQNFAGSINSSNYRWDSAAAVPYLSVDNSGTSSDQFLTYDNEQSVVEKVRYAKNRGLGGWIIWELNGDYLPTQTPNQPLLTAIKNELGGSGGSGGGGDITKPSVTINQANSQTDPTSGLPINFTVVFSEAVTGFTSGDVAVSGTAPGSKSVSISGSGPTYNVAISGITGSGTVVATIPAGAVADLAGNTSNASTSSDNTVTYVAPDTTPPTVTINQAPGQADPTGSLPIAFAVNFSETVTGFTSGDVSVSGTAPGTKTVSLSGSGTSYTVTIGGVTGSGTVIASIPAGAVADLAGNASVASTSSDNTVTYNAPDTTPPTVTINQAPGQADPTGSLPIAFAVNFSEPVTGFTSGDVSVSGTAPGTKTVSLSGSGTSYTVTIGGVTGGGTVIASIPAGAVADLAGNASTASTSSDNTVTYNAPDTTPPTVTINQAPSQADPTSSLPVNFMVNFSETVTGFTASDVSIGGSATGAKTVTMSGSGSSFMVSVGGMTGGGTIIATIPAGMVADLAGNANMASTSSDNTVMYNAPDTTPPSVTINQAPGQADPTGSLPIAFAVQFSEPVLGFTSGDVVVSGTAAGTKSVAISGSGTTFTVTIDGVTGNGTVIATIPAGAVTDSFGNLSLASTSSDNVVTFTS